MCAEIQKCCTVRSKQWESRHEKLKKNENVLKKIIKRVEMKNVEK